MNEPETPSMTPIHPIADHKDSLPAPEFATPNDASIKLTYPQPLAGSILPPTTTNKKGSNKCGTKRATKASAAHNSGGQRRSSLSSKKEKRERKMAVSEQAPATSDSSSSALNQPNPSSSKVSSDMASTSANMDRNLDEEANGSAVTRCVCGEDNEEANDVIMFQCDKCSVWQHGPCVGLYDEFPGDYFCELCRPDLHANGNYRQSPPPLVTARNKRSPSLTSTPATSHRRERVTADAASLAAFLTDAGVKPEDQVSIGDFALPIFAQTRRQSNMLVDPTKKQRSPSTEPNETVTKETVKVKRKRHVEDVEEASTTEEPDQITNGEEKPKRRRISPVATQMTSPASSTLNLAVNTQANASSAAPGLSTPTVATSAPVAASVIPKNNKRTRKTEDPDESMKTKAFGPKPSLANPAPPAAQGGNGATSTAQRRCSPAKRSKDDGRKPAREPTPLDSGGGWGLPDHLAYLSYLLPTPSPALIAPFEPATRVKFPAKRVTIADMRKRAKHLVDYLTKVQIETSEREKRSELISKAAGPSSPTDITYPVVSAETLEIMDDLTRELYHWQEKYKQ